MNVNDRHVKNIADAIVWQEDRRDEMAEVAYDDMAAQAFRVARADDARRAQRTREASRDDRWTEFRVEIDQQGYDKWIDVRVLEQFYSGDEHTLRSVEWTEKTRHEGRTLRGISGKVYQFPKDPAHVYVQWGDGMNSHSADVLDASSLFSVDDLLNLAAAAYDDQYGFHGIDSSDTSPFRPFVAREVAR